MMAVKPRTLQVFMDGVLAGEVNHSPQGALTFIYDAQYRLNENATPLSLSLPLAIAEHRPKPVRAYLDGLLPDSPAARARWAAEFGVSANNPFSLLAHVGRDAAGAVQVLPPGVPAPDAAARTGDIEWLSEDDFAEMARDLARNGDNWDPGRFGGRWSLAGAQPKMALFKDPETGRWGVPRDSTPTTHIIKPAIEGFAHHHVNEALCLRAASEVGLSAARVDLIELSDVQAVISHRYDRRREAGGRWARVHQEDFCQALAVHPSLKYQSDGGPGIADMAQALSRLQIDDRRFSSEQLFRAVVFNVLIGGTDAHAKNYSLLLVGQRARLAPLYDVASAACYPQHGRLSSPMKIGEHWRMLDVNDRDWAKAARQLGLPADEGVAMVEALRSALPDAFARALSGLPAQVRTVGGQMADRIVAHVNREWRPDLDRNPSRVIRP